MSGIETPATHGVAVETLKQWRSSAQAALARLAAGAQTAQAEYDGERIAYSKNEGGEASLRAWIAELNAAIGDGAVRGRRSLRVSF